MNKLAVKIHVCLIVSVISGCALDMRCDDVRTRVDVHAGSTWYMYEDDDDDKVKTTGAKAISSDYCVTRTGKKRANTAGALRGDDLMRVATPKSLETYDKKAVCKLDKDDPGPGDGVPQNAQEAKERYLRKKELYLTADGLELRGEPKKFPLVLVNTGLNCAADGKDQAFGWICNKKDDVPIASSGNTLLEACLKLKKHLLTRRINYVGTMDDRYCLFVSVIETKPKSRTESFWPTNINRDRIKAELQCVVSEGTAPPGVIVGGPRPNFEAPITASPTEMGAL